MQTITTKYLGPTTHRGSRVVARTASGLRFTFGWRYDVNQTLNHYLAAEQVANALNWTGVWHAGGTQDGMVFVLAYPSDPAFVVEER